MSDLQKLLTWMSPAFPVGAFAWSAGLETAIVAGVVHDRQTTQEWIEGILRHGSLRTDAIFLAHAHRADGDSATLTDLTELHLALTPALERHGETVTTGHAFSAAALAWTGSSSIDLPDPCPYPIAVGALARANGVKLGATLLAWLTATVHSQVSVAVRLVPIGQTDGLAIMAGMEPAIAAAAEWSEDAGLDDIGTIGYGADIAQMQHETLPTRIFRS